MYGDNLENNQELANAYKIVYEHLEDINAHSLNALLSWTMEGEENPVRDEVLYRAHLTLTQYLSKH